MHSSCSFDKKYAYVFGGKSPSNALCGTIEKLNLKWLSNGWESFQATICNGQGSGASLQTTFPAVIQANSCEICILGGSATPKDIFLFNVNDKSMRILAN